MAWGKLQQRTNYVGHSCQPLTTDSSVGAIPTLILTLQPSDTSPGFQGGKLPPGCTSKLETPQCYPLLCFLRPTPRRSHTDDAIVPHLKRRLVHGTLRGALHLSAGTDGGRPDLRGPLRRNKTQQARERPRQQKNTSKALQPPPREHICFLHRGGIRSDHPPYTFLTPPPISTHPTATSQRTTLGSTLLPGHKR